MSTILIIVLAVVLVAVFALILIYNNLVTLKNRFKNAFAQISVQLQRRYELIPNLVEIAKKYMSHEQETLKQVIAARNNAIDANNQAKQQPLDADKIKSLAAAENNLYKSLGSFFALAESYPELKANQTMQQLMEELSTTENKVAFARQAYNDAVMFYNTACEQFPNSIVANACNFAAAELLTIEDQETTKPIKVSFN